MSDQGAFSSARPHGLDAIVSRAVNALNVKRVMGDRNRQLAGPESLVIDDRSLGDLNATIGGAWRLVSDQVMGGVSRGSLQVETIHGRSCLRMQGAVSTDYNGGFLQMSLELAGGRALDVADYDAFLLTISGNHERYNLHARTSDLFMPWQSYRASFDAESAWQTVEIPFEILRPHRTVRPFRPGRLTRIGLVAIGRDFQADICLGDIRLLRKDA